MSVANPAYRAVIIMWPRDHAYKAYEIYQSTGRDAAIEYLKKECPPEWQKLAYTHLKNMARKNAKKMPMR